MKRYISVLLVILLLLSSLISFADSKIIHLTEIVYDDANNLYLSANIGEQENQKYLRINKTMSGDYTPLTQFEQQQLIKKINQTVGLLADTLVIKNSMHLAEDSHYFKGKQLSESLKVVDNWLYDKANNIRLLDVSTYIEQLNGYYRDNNIADKKPLDPVVNRYALTSGMLYHNLNYIDVEGSAAFGYWVFPDNDYLLVVDKQVKPLEISEDFMLNRLIAGVNNDYWLIGERLISRYRSVSTIYHLAEDGTVKSVNALFESMTNAQDKSDQFDLNAIFIGKTNADVVVYVKPSANWFDVDLTNVANHFYNISANLEVTERAERSIDMTNETVLGAERCYLGQANQIYYMVAGQNNIYNLTTGQSCMVNTKYQIGDVIGSYKKIAAVASIYDKNINQTYQVAEYLIDDQDEPYICVEDLTCCGYDLVWDNNARSTDMVYNGANFKKHSQQQKRSGDIYYSDITVKIDGQMVDSLNIGGFSLVSVADAKKMINIKAGAEAAIGTIMGDVLYTDIKTYFNGELINGINVDGYTAISARAFQGRGYTVTFDEAKRRVDINRTDKQVEKIFEKPLSKDLKVGTVIGHILATDIVVYIDGTRMAAYNFDGYMVVMVPYLVQPDNGISVEYNNITRKLMVETE